jgi:hypothetical protein
MLSDFLEVCGEFQEVSELYHEGCSSIEYASFQCHETRETRLTELRERVSRVSQMNREMNSNLKSKDFNK